MKKLLSLLAFTGFIVSVHAQKLEAKDVPAPVTDAFNTSHPATKDADWKKDGKYYAASYELNKLSTSVTYDISGSLITTDEGIPVLNLPKCIADYVRLNFPHNKIKKASKITGVDNTISYKAKVDDQNLIFDNSCNLSNTEKAND
jgi:hypothetical protein